jgi:hypothetical protein
LVQSFGGLLSLALIVFEVLLRVLAMALSGFGLFSGVAFGSGHDDLLGIVMTSILDTKETMSH